MSLYSLLNVFKFFNRKKNNLDFENEMEVVPSVEKIEKKVEEPKVKEQQTQPTKPKQSKPLNGSKKPQKTTNQKKYVGPIKVQKKKKDQNIKKQRFQKNFQNLN